MNQEENSIMSINSKIIVGIFSIVMTGVSIYLTYHYFEAHYPQGLSTSSLCNFTSIFSCDTASFSPLSNIYKIPISIFGAVVGLFFLVGSFTQSRKIIYTNSFLIRFVALGSLLLLLYSIFILGTLCPYCTIFQLSSFVLFFIFYKQLKITMPDKKVLTIYSVIIVIIGTVVRVQIYYADKKIETMTPVLMKEYDKYPNLGTPKTMSPYRIASSTKQFIDAPIQISVFSDFQCPPCKRLAEQMPKIATRYRGKINIQYYFHPLDNNCHPEMKRPMHTLACKAAYIASCAGDNFEKVHDDIFKHQRSLTNEWLLEYAKKTKTLKCMNNPATKELVVKLINASKQYNIRSTPTWILNGVKIEGIFPLATIYSIIDTLLVRAEQAKK